MKPRNPIERRDARTATTATDGPNGSGDQHHRCIAALAFAFYERRGRQDGHALDDWLAAERQILFINVPRTFEVAQRTRREARMQRRENVRLKRLVGEWISELKCDEEVWA